MFSNNNNFIRDEGYHFIIESEDKHILHYDYVTEP